MANRPKTSLLAVSREEQPHDLLRADRKTGSDVKTTLPSTTAAGRGLVRRRPMIRGANAIVNLRDRWLPACWVLSPAPVPALRGRAGWSRA